MDEWFRRGLNPADENGPLVLLPADAWRLDPSVLPLDPSVLPVD